MNGIIRVSQRETSVRSLGPGRRFVLWVQGCTRNCPGCVSTGDQPLDGGYPMTTGALAAEIALSRPDGVTISGGEPFLQAEAIAEMLRMVRRDFGYDTGVIVYTGFLLEELRQMPSAAPLLEQTDLLIDGPYVQELDDGKSLRGSSNQRVIPLTDRYDRPEILSLYGAEGRQTEYFWHGGSINCVGVDSHRDPLEKSIRALSPARERTSITDIQEEHKHEPQH